MQRKFVRVLSLVLAFSLVAGSLLVMFVMWPPLAIIVAAVGIAAYLIYRSRKLQR